MQGLKVKKKKKESLQRGEMSCGTTNSSEHMMNVSNQTRQAVTSRAGHTRFITVQKVRLSHKQTQDIRVRQPQKYIIITVRALNTA